jgi:hypothetical protein
MTVAPLHAASGALIGEKKLFIRHPREGGGPVKRRWIPAFAGMTGSLHGATMSDTRKPPTNEELFATMNIGAKPDTDKERITARAMSVLHEGMARQAEHQWPRSPHNNTRSRFM